MPETAKKRKDWVDALRALAIVPYLFQTPGQGVDFLWEHVKKILIGQNTLTIYLLHSVVVKDVVKIFKSVHIPINRLSNVW